jgi:hypothetical protein
MPIKDADPDALSLDAAFKEAMEAPAKPREAPPPPEIDQDAPHGRDDDGNPLAPFGLTKDGKVRRSAAGRPAKDARPRTGPVPPPEPPGKPGPPAPPADYSRALDELADAIWLALNGVAMAGPHVPVVGRFIPEEKLQAQAYVLSLNKPRLCKAMQVAAEHNAGAARTCAKLAQGDITWVITAGALVMPFFAQSAAVFKGDEALASFGEEATVKNLAASNKVLMDSYVAQMQVLAEQEEARIQAEMAETNGQPVHA